MLGHDVVVYNRDDKLGGLNEYGIAAYKAVENFAQREVDYILSIGGIEVRNGTALGNDFTLAELRNEYDAVFIGLGLAAVNELGLENEDLPGVESAIDYIAELRQSDDLSSLPVGASVLVIGGGMTAIDIAVQVDDVEEAPRPANKKPARKKATARKTRAKSTTRKSRT